MTELTGKPDLVQAVGMFVHKDDKVCVKVNGIAQQNMTTNKELVLPFVEAMIAGGVTPENITLLEQWYGYFAATRINEKNVPAGVKISIHNNTDAKIDEIFIKGAGVSTKFCTALTDATAVINFGLLKDHSVSGYTGALKNITQAAPHLHRRTNSPPPRPSADDDGTRQGRANHHLQAATFRRAP